MSSRQVTEFRPTEVPASQLPAHLEIVGETIIEAFRENLRRIPDRDALRRRNDHGWESVTWREYGRSVSEITAGLYELGIRPGEHVAIFSNNRLEWHFADIGSLAGGYVVVPLYPTSAPEQVAYLLGHSESRVCFVEGNDLLERVLRVREELPKLHRIVPFERTERSGDPLILHLDELRSLGSELLERDSGVTDQLAEAITPDDLATLVYTSGTTGPPKGAMITHRNVMWIARSALPFLEVQPGERFLSFLPLSHVAERIISDFSAIITGGETWFAQSLGTVPQDLNDCRPTVFFAVPRVWEKLQEGVLERVRQRPAPQRLAVEQYLRLGAQVIARRQAKERPRPWEEIPYKILDGVVGSRVRHELGLDQAHILASSAAPIRQDLLCWLHAAGLHVLEAYGQTETCGPTTSNPPSDIRIGTVGVPLPGIQVTIGSDEEVLVRGGNVCRGYFRDPESTRELIDDERVMHTGDTGAFDADGYLRITGRKKDLIITAAGQNISPYEIECDLEQNGIIGEAVVIGDGRRYLTALVTLDPDLLADWARQHAKSADYDRLVSDPDVGKEVDRIIAKVNSSRARVENIRKFRILDRPFSIESGEVTPTLKVRRQNVIDKFGNVIEAMYDQS